MSLLHRSMQARRVDRSQVEEQMQLVQLLQQAVDRDTKLEAAAAMAVAGKEAAVAVAAAKIKAAKKTTEVLKKTTEVLKLKLQASIGHIVWLRFGAITYFLVRCQRVQPRCPSRLPGCALPFLMPACPQPLSCADQGG